MKEFTIICLLILTYGCLSGSKNKESNFEEVKDIKIVTRQNETDKKLSYNNDSLAGHWFQPHAAMINIDFSKDGTFVFNSFDVEAMKDEKLIGTYTIENKKIMMNVTNFQGRKEVFDIKTNEGGYYIEKKGFYLVKAYSY